MSCTPSRSLYSYIYAHEAQAIQQLFHQTLLSLLIGDTVRYVLQIMYMDSNNAAEYEALLHGLRLAVSMGIQRLEVRGYSNLAISQINGDFDAKDSKMAAYRNTILKMLARFEGLKFHHVA